MSEINNITDDRKHVIENIKAVMSSFPTIKSAFIFGSYAKGNYNRFSDIDIMIDCGIDEYFEIVERLESIDTIRRFDVHNVNYSGFKFDKEKLGDVIQLR